MATIKNTSTEYPAAGLEQGRLVQWGPMANGDVGDAFDMSGFEPLSVQLEGTLGTGGSFSLKGSNNGGTNFEVLHDPAGNAVTLTALGIKAVGDNTHQVRPEITAGDGTTSLTVSLWVRKALHR